MTRLHLIRHGRATAMEAHYDQLHPDGEQQARLLGEHFSRIGQRWHAVYVGPLLRQRETFRLMREAAGAVGATWPEPIALQGLAEGPFEMLMRKFVRARLEHDATAIAYARELRAPASPETFAEALRGLFAHMTELWRSGEVAADELETAAAFEARVLAAFDTMRTREGLGREVAAITSSGVIGHLLLHAGLPGEGAADRPPLYNTSVSVLELEAARVVVRAHNLTDHLSDPQHLTVL